MKSRLARKRDKWFASEEGKKCADILSLPLTRHYKNNEIYLKNRLERAFLAGASAGVEAGREDLAEMESRNKAHYEC